MTHEYHAGIDYGMGRSNIDAATGLRFGVISKHSVGEAWYEDAEPDYGKAHCPKCGNEALDSGDDCAECEESTNDYDARNMKDYHCHHCATDDGERIVPYSFWSDMAFGDEALGYSYESNGYTLTDCLDSDIFVLKSPYFTRGQFCSPCVPGAINLDNADMRGERGLCLGHEWFENGIAPYPVFSVATGELVLPS